MLNTPNQPRLSIVRRFGPNDPTPPYRFIHMRTDGSTSVEDIQTREQAQRRCDAVRVAHALNARRI